MLRINRSRFLGILSVAIFIYFLVFTESGSSSSNFRANTESGLARKREREQDLPLRGHLSDEDLTKKTNDELQAILNSHSQEKLAKDEYGNSLGQQFREPTNNAPTRADLESQGWTREDPIHNAPVKIDKSKPSHEVADLQTSHQEKKPLKTSQREDDAESSEARDADPVQKKLDEYLKSPVVIFSKSYCPHSRKAKQLLLDIYKINPKPLVVELDQLTELVSGPTHHSSPPYGDHEGHSKKSLGKALQDLLAEKTGRRTVPNIVVGGEHSIGGNDNLWSMHESGTLAEEIRKFGGRKVISVDVNDTED